MKLIPLIVISFSAAAASMTASSQAQPEAQEATMSAQPMGRGMMMGGDMMNGMMNCPMPGMMGGRRDYIDGRIAFLKAELQIAPAQEKVWQEYADELRSIHQSMSARKGQMMQGRMMRGGMMQKGAGMMRPDDNAEGQPAPEALETRIASMEAALKTLKKLQTATDKLYEALNDDQKAVADELLGAACGPGRM